MQLLYERNCKAVQVPVRATWSDWQTMSVPHVGPPLTVGRWDAPRTGVFSMTMLDDGAAAALDNVSLEGVDRGSSYAMENSRNSWHIAFRWRRVSSCHGTTTTSILKCSSNTA